MHRGTCQPSRQTAGILQPYNIWVMDDWTAAAETWQPAHAAASAGYKTVEILRACSSIVPALQPFGHLATYPAVLMPPGAA